MEVNLCGHATMAAAHAIFTNTDQPGNVLHMSTKSGMLTVSRIPTSAGAVRASDGLAMPTWQVTRNEGGLLSMDLPEWPQDSNPGLLDVSASPPMISLFGHFIIPVLATHMCKALSNCTQQILASHRLPRTQAVADAVGARPLETHWTEGFRDALAIFDSPQTVLALQPDFSKLDKLPPGGLICSAQGRFEDQECDFVYRFFAPRWGVEKENLRRAGLTS